MLRLTRLFALAALLVPASASADAVSMPPSCPEGSMSAFCHGPATCEIQDCSTAGCPTGFSCVPRDLCVRSHTCCTSFGCGTSITREHVTGPCGPGGACRDGTSACMARMVCVAGSIDAGPGRPDSGPAPTDSGPPDTDAGSTDPDAGGPDDDGGAADMDAGEADPDAGGADEDAGGPSGMDSGPANPGIDAGPGGPSDGGCCSVAGQGSSTGGLFAMLAVCGIAFARRRRRRSV